jgi:GDPmannose 4,6-dehydratase
MPEYTGDIVAMGTLRLHKALRDHVLRSSRPVRYYQAGSSEMFGAAPPPNMKIPPFTHAVPTV